MTPDGSILLWSPEGGTRESSPTDRVTCPFPPGPAHEGDDTGSDQCSLGQDPPSRKSFHSPLEQMRFGRRIHSTPSAVRNGFSTPSCSPKVETRGRSVLVDRSASAEMILDERSHLEPRGPRSHRENNGENGLLEVSVRMYYSRVTEPTCRDHKHSVPHRAPSQRVRDAPDPPQQGAASRE